MNSTGKPVADNYVTVIIKENVIRVLIFCSWPPATAICNIKRISEAKITSLGRHGSAQDFDWSYPAYWV